MLKSPPQFGIFLTIPGERSLRFANNKVAAARPVTKFIRMADSPDASKSARFPNSVTNDSKLKQRDRPQT